MSITLNSIVVEKEKSKLLNGEKRKKAENAAQKMKNVSRKTLDDDVYEGAQEAMELQNQ